MRSMHSTPDRPVSDTAYAERNLMDDSAKTMNERNRNLARSTIVVMIAFGIAKAISLVQTVVIADVFGLSQEWDAFVVANSIPELIFTLIAGGALAHAFIPVFSGFLARDDQQGAWRTATHVINTIFVATLLISILTFFAAPWPKPSNSCASCSSPP
jgi:putative peptidoglycan lipid II flippase